MKENLKNKTEENVETAKQLLLDPFQPIFPIPGMWHAAVGNICVLIAFGLATISFVTNFEQTPDKEILTIWGAGLFVIIPIILASRGISWAFKLLQFLSFASISVLIFDFVMLENIRVVTLTATGFAIIAILFLRSNGYKMLASILTIRRNKIIEMKKDGTYKQKLEEARKRWNRRK